MKVCLDYWDCEIYRIRLGFIFSIYRVWDFVVVVNFVFVVSFYVDGCYFEYWWDEVGEECGLVCGIKFNKFEGCVIGGF